MAVNDGNSALSPADQEDPGVLSTYDVTSQGRWLLIEFLRYRIQRDGIVSSTDVSELEEPGAPPGPPLQHSVEIVRHLREMGDQWAQNRNLQQLIDRVPVEYEKDALLSVAAEIFADGIFNWGRIAALFFFVYSLCARALDRSVGSIINPIMEFFGNRVAPWVVGRGGWEAIQEGFGLSGTEWYVAGAIAAGGIVAAAVYLRST